MPKKGLNSGVVDRWRKPILVFKYCLEIKALFEYRSMATLRCEMWREEQRAVHSEEASLKAP